GRGGRERREEERRSRAEELVSLEQRGNETGDAAAAKRAREALAHAARVAEARLRQRAQQMAERLREMPVRARDALPAAAAGLTRRVEEAGGGGRGRGPRRRGGGPGSP